MGAVEPSQLAAPSKPTNDGGFVSAGTCGVTDIKTAERQTSEFAMIVESSQDAIMTATLDGTITFWNAAATRMYGYDARCAVSQHMSMLAAPGCGAEIDAILARLRAGDRIEHCEMLRLTKAGDLLAVDTLLCPVRDRAGAIAGICVTTRDIAEHLRAKYELTRLYEQQRHIALTLQHALMGSPRPVPGLQRASRYLPAIQGAGVGGDWFDLIALGAGRVGALIGDVMGRGLEAATVMGQLRSAANALARTGMGPRQLMEALDQVAQDIPDQLTTCCYLVIDPDAGEVTACSAGHLPVLLVDPDGTVGRLPVPVSVPLGVGGIPHRQVTVPAPEGATLVLYTDGLVETRGCDIDQQVMLLQERLHAIFAGSGGLEDAADQLLAAQLPQLDTPLDDVTLLLARIPPGPLASTEMMLKPTLRAAASGRRLVAKTLAEWGHLGHVDVACLLVSEVLTNAVQHAGGPIGLRLYLTGREIITEITDDSTHPPLARPADLEAENGRGLILVDTLASSWGSRPAENGKTVWFTLSLESAPG